MINRLFIGSPKLQNKVMRGRRFFFMMYYKWRPAIIKRPRIWSPNLLQVFLGEMYTEGKGLMQNYKKAYMWFNLAIHNGYSDTKKLETQWQRNLALKI